MNNFFDSSVTHRPRRGRCADALPCSIGIAREVFRQVSAVGQPFRAQPATPQTSAPGCHPTAVFSLRHRPGNAPANRRLRPGSPPGLAAAGTGLHRHPHGNPQSPLVHDTEDVEALAEKLCRVVREQPAQHPVTISIGLARVLDGDTLNQALVKADEALYESKHTGKDRYTFHL